MLALSQNVYFFWYTGLCSSCNRILLYRFSSHLCRAIGPYSLGSCCQKETLMTHCPFGSQNTHSTCFLHLYSLSLMDTTEVVFLNTITVSEFRSESRTHLGPCFQFWKQPGGIWIETSGVCSVQMSLVKGWGPNQKLKIVWVVRVTSQGYRVLGKLCCPRC